MDFQTLIEQFKHLHFVEPLVLFLIPLIFIIAWLKPGAGLRDHAFTRFPSSRLLEGVPKGRRISFLWVPRALRLGTMVMIIIAMALPRGFIGYSKSSTEGIDIVLAIDVSLSMLAKDLKPNRLEAAKKTAAEFIENRPNDRIGLVAFSGASAMMCPITTDHPRVLEQVSALRTGMLEDGTAIGDGLASAVARLKDSESKSKVIILLTDGVNNKGIIYPETASEMAQAYNIRVYTIGVGTIGKAESPVGIYPNGQIVYQLIDVEIDDMLLNQIAQKTGGQYFRATSNYKLQNIYSEIDKLEKTRLFSFQFHEEPLLVFPFLLIALVFLLLEIILRLTILAPVV